MGGWRAFEILFDWIITSCPSVKWKWKYLTVRQQIYPLQRKNMWQRGNNEEKPRSGRRSFPEKRLRNKPYKIHHSLKFYSSGHWEGGREPKCYGVILSTILMNPKLSAKSRKAKLKPLLSITWRMPRKFPLQASGGLRRPELRLLLHRRWSGMDWQKLFSR